MTLDIFFKSLEVFIDLIGLCKSTRTQRSPFNIVKRIEFDTVGTFPFSFLINPNLKGLKTNLNVKHHGCPMPIKICLTVPLPLKKAALCMKSGETVPLAEVPYGKYTRFQINTYSLPIAKYWKVRYTLFN